MALHLLKMCVGIDSIDHLRQVQAARLARLRDAGEAARLCHWTRNMPRRAGEVTDGGSIYWIVKGYIRVRQRILAIERVQDRPAPKNCALVLDSRLVATVPRRARPIQGWRYLAPADAPRDGRHVPADIDGMPDAMAEELRELGLL